MSRLAIILLAAGGSRRLGSPKQLIDVDGVPLIHHLCRRLLAINPTVFIAVVGADADRVTAAVEKLPVQIVRNESWSQGLGTSIAAGIRAAESTGVDSALLALCDQPSIPESHFRALIDGFGSNDFDIVASEYDGAPGVPSVFARTVFDRLLSLSGDRGAKSLMNDPALRVQRISCDAARIDLDTRSDVESFRAGQSREQI